MIPEIKKTITVNASQARAFEVFTGGIGRWWPFAGHSISENYGSTAKTVIMTPKVGGPLTEHSADGEEYIWGKVKDWEPSSHVRFSWLMGIEEDLASEVDVTFETDGDKCRVTLIHRNWDGYGDGAQEKRDNYDTGWGHVFGECYADACS